MARFATPNSISSVGWKVRAETSRTARLARKSFQLALPIAAWSMTAVILGSAIGFAAIALPPAGAFGVVGLVGLVLLWAMPDLAVTPERALRVAFAIVLFCMVCVPNYYALQLPALPWISIRRLALFAMFIPLAMMIGGSSKFRRSVSDKMKANKLVTKWLLSFFLWITLSIIVSINLPGTITKITDDSMTWYIPFFVAVYTVNSFENGERLVRRICYFSLFVAAMGIVEFCLQRRFYFDLLPKWYLSALVENNPAVAEMVNRPLFRNGMYRASSIFGVSLPFGEFEAMIAPLGWCLLIHGRTLQRRWLGAVVSTIAPVALFTSGARGGYISMLAALLVFVAASIVRYARQNRNSLLPPLAILVSGAGAAAIVALILSWGRLHKTIIGGGMEQYSTNARWEQWALLKPRLFENVIAPIFGHGVGNSGAVIPYFTAPEARFPSIDSYVLTLLSDVGIPGAVLFFGMIAIAVYLGVRRFADGRTEDSALIGAVSSGILAYGVYRITLSQQENNFLFFVLLGILVALNFAEDERGRHEGPRQSTGSDPGPAPP